MNYYKPKNSAWRIVHRRLVFRNPLFREELKHVVYAPLPKDLGNAVRENLLSATELSRKWGLDELDIINNEIGSTILNESKANRRFDDYAIASDDYFVYSIKKDINTFELEDLASDIREKQKFMKIKPVKRNEGVNADLWLAVFIARTKGDSFKYIHQKLKTKSLPFYSKRIPTTLISELEVKNGFEMKYSRNKSTLFQ